MAHLSTIFRPRLSAASLLLAALLAVSPALGQAPTAPTDVAPAMGTIEGLLLLKNGELLEGRISRSGDYYLIVSPTAEVQIRIRDVEATCRDLEEVFAKKLSLVNTRSADSYLSLAQWCIDKQLYGHAARALTEAYRLDDVHPRIALLERRMEAAMAAPRPTPIAAKPVAPRFSDDELDRTAKSVSSESLHEYTVRVQPLLMNYCATAGCHGPRPGSTFHLERVHLNERTDPRTIRTNLHAVLKIVDRDQPAKSPLLNVPITAHGGGKKAIFNNHNAEHYRTLAGWAARVAAIRPPVAMPSSADVASSLNTLQQRLPIAPPAATAPAPADKDLSSAVTLDAANGPTTALPAATIAPAPQPIAPPPSSAPSPRPSGIDPFDADVFNRRREAEKK